MTDPTPDALDEAGFKIVPAAHHDWMRRRIDRDLEIIIGLRIRIRELEAERAALTAKVERLTRLGDELSYAAKKHRKLSTPAAWEVFCAAIDAWEER